MKKLLTFSVIILLIGVSIILPTGSISKVSFLYKSNNPPYVPRDPIPPDGANNISICPPNLSWFGGDPDGDNVTYDIYFGKDPFNLPLISHNQTNTTYNSFNDNLDFNTSYYWQIIAWDEHSLNTSGSIWIFKTEENLPPYEPSNPHPEDGANYVLIDGLSWEGGDPNECDILIYDLYFDDVNPPTQVTWKQTENWWKLPYNLTKFKTYYWMVVVWDSGGLSNRSPIWSFIIIDTYPSDPIIDGPKMGKPNVDYEFTFVSTDPIGEDIKYYIKWGDGNEYETDFYPSGFVVKLNHTWEKRGTYVIQAQAKDIYGYKSDWSKYIFKVPKSKVLTNSLFLQIFEHFPKLFSSLRYIFKL